MLLERVKKYQKRGPYACLLVLCIGVFAFGADSPSGGRKAALAPQEIGRVHRVKRFSTRDILLPTEELPGWFSVEVEHEGMIETLELERCSIRGENFEVLAHRADGTFIRIDPGPERTYRGRVKGHPNSTVAAMLLPWGMRATVHTEFGPSWNIRPVKRIDPTARRGRHIVFSQADAEPEDVNEPTGPDVIDGAAVAYYSAAQATTTAAASTAIGAAAAGMYSVHGSDVMQAEAAIDVEYDYYEKWKSDGPDEFETINANIAATMNEMNVIYVRDCMIEYVLGRVIIRTSAETCPYYTTERDFSKLGVFRSEWRANQSDSTHDLAALCFRGGGGVAWVGVVCGSYAYSANGDSSDGTFHHVWRHEAGHNWGCADYHKGCLEGKTILCGNSMSVSRFSMEEVKTILKHRDSRSCLVNIGPYVSAVAPYAALDIAVVNLGDGPVAIDALANDHDANGDVLAIEAHDGFSSLGGRITLSAGTGPAGRDELIYTPPTDKHGQDSFAYLVADGTGNHTLGTVLVEIRTLGLVGYWKLDETSGLIASDSSSGNNDGILTDMNEDDWVGGMFGNALDFDDVNDYLYMEDFTLPRDSFTLSLWFKPAKDLSKSNSRRDLIYWHRGGDPHLTFNRAGDGRIGLHVEVEGKEYNDVTTATTSWPSVRWRHIGATFDGSDFKMYVNGEIENTVSHPGLHDAAEGLSLGSDEGSKPFGCRIDDVRFYNYALSPAQMRELREGGRAEYPKPADKITNVRPYTGYQWLPGALAFAQDVYLGRSYAAVANATTESCEYMGRLHDEHFIGPALKTNTEYFWRVDRVTMPGTAFAGTVWSFTTGQAGPYDSIYQAEDAVLSGPEVKTSEAGYKGSGYADYMNMSDDYIEWAVFAHYAGEYNLSFRYALASGNRPLDISKDGDVIVESFDFPNTGSYTNWRFTPDISMTLRAGPNTIRAAAIGDKGANIDYLKVTETDPPGMAGDISGNGVIDVEDYARFAAHWGDKACADNPPCGGADLDGNRNCNWCDLAFLAEVWLEGK